MKRYLIRSGLGVLIVLSVLTGNALAQATTYTSAGTGEWGTAATWVGDSGFPVDGDNAVISNAAHTVTVEADHAALETSFGADGTLAISDGATLTSTVTTAVSGTGTLNFEGVSAVNGSIGTTDNLLGLINTQADDGTGIGEAGFGGSVYAQELRINDIAGDTDAASVVFEDGASFNNGADMGAITTTADGYGTLVLNGNSVINASVGDSDNHLYSIVANGGAGNAVYLLGGVYLTDALDFQDDVTVTADDVFEVGSVSTAADNTGVLILNNVSSIGFNIGNNGEIPAWLKEVDVGQDDSDLEVSGLVYTRTLGLLGTVSLDYGAENNPTLLTENIKFYGDGQVTLDDGEELASVTTQTGGQGTLRFGGAATITGNVGEDGASLGTVMSYGAGSVVDIQGDLYAQELYFGADSEVDVAGTVGLGTVTAEPGEDGAGLGTLSFGQGGNVSGPVGAEDAYLRLIKVTQAEGGNFDVKFNDQVYTDGILFTGEGAGGDDTTITFKNAAEAYIGLDGIVTDWAGHGIIAFKRNATVDGPVGTEEAYFGRIRVDRITEFNGDVYLDGLKFSSYRDDAAATFYADAFIGAEGITNISDGYGTVTFNGNAQVDGMIGADDSWLAQVNFNNGEATLTCSACEGTFEGSSWEWNIDNSATVRVPNGGQFYGGPLLVHDGGTLDIKDAETDLDGALTLESGGTLRLTIHNTEMFGKLVAGSDTTVASDSKIIVDVAEDAEITDGDTFQVVSVSSIGAGSLSAPSLEDDSSDWDFDVAANDLGEGTWEILLTASATESTEPASFEEQATNDNAGGAGASLDNARDGATGDMQNVIDTLDGLSSDEVAGSLNSMLPDLSGTNPEVPGMLMDNFVGTQMDHLGGLMDLARAGEGEETGIAAGDQPGKYITWVQAFGNAAHQDPRGTSHGYNLSNGGAAVGVEQVMSDRFRMGLAFGEAQGYVRSKDNAARTEILATQFSWYGGYQSPESPLYLEYALSYAYNDYNGSREINVGPGDQRVANSDFHGDLYGGMFEAGYGIKFGKAVFTPSLGLNYNHLHVAKYSETDAGALSLNVGAQDYDRLRTILGGKLAARKSCSFGTLTPEAHVKFLYDVVAERQQIAASFSGGGTGFATEGFKPAKFGADLGGSLTLATKKNMTITLQYDFEAREDYYAHTGFVNVAFKF